MTADLLRLFVVEATSRAVQAAREKGDGTVTSEHLHSILPQLMLDFF